MGTGRDSDGESQAAKHRLSGGLARAGVNEPPVGVDVALRRAVRDGERTLALALELSRLAWPVISWLVVAPSQAEADAAAEAEDTDEADAAIDAEATLEAEDAAEANANANSDNQATEPDENSSDDEDKAQA